MALRGRTVLGVEYLPTVFRILGNKIEVIGLGVGLGQLPLVGEHFVAGKRQEIFVVEVLVGKAHLVVGIGHDIVTPGLILLLQLLGRKLAVGHRGMGVQIGLKILGYIG